MQLTLGAMVRRGSRVGNAKRRRNDGGDGAMMNLGDNSSQDEEHIDISDMDCRDELPTDDSDAEELGEESRPSFWRYAKDPSNPWSLAKWVRCRNRWVFIPDWFFSGDRQHDPECNCRHCAIWTAAEKEHEKNQTSSS